MKNNLGVDFVPMQGSSIIHIAQCSSSTYDQMPDMSIQLDEYVYTLPKKSYILFEDGNCYLLLMAKDFGSKTTWELQDGVYQ
jgi:hypothetical protein